MADRLPPLEPGTCAQCGGTTRPLVGVRCDLCSAVISAESPEPIASILPRVLRDLFHPKPDAA